jgi:hypothetical protein
LSFLLSDSASFFCPFGVHSARKDKKDKKDRGHSEGSVVAVYFQMLVLDVFFYEVNLLAEKTLLSGGDIKHISFIVKDG